MFLYCTEFVFDGVSSKEYDMIICSFNGSSNGEVTAGSNIEFTTFKAPGVNRWLKTGATYNEQLTFNFQICKYKCNQPISEPISERELAFLMRWLVRKEFRELQFIQEGYENIYYNCQINVQKYEVAGECYGLTLTVICDAPWGWSEQMTSTISSSTSTTMQLYDSSDEIGVVYPSIEIISKSSQDISISNKMNGIKMLIRNCVANEQIDIRDKIITSSECYESSVGTGYAGNHSTLYDDFNWKWFAIGNTFNNRVNEITVNGNCDIKLSWRVPRKAVV